MPDQPLTLEWLPGRYAVCRLEPHDPVPEWANVNETHRHEEEPSRGAPLLCITRTERELSIVIDEARLPPDAKIKAERGFVILRIAGTLDFNLTGIIARLTAPLAKAKIPVFVISTFDTDVILLRHRDAQLAAEALRNVANLNASVPPIL